jgi:choline monooxygenase
MAVGVLRYRKGRGPKYGTIWLTYTHVMVEWYPHVLVVSTLLSHREPDKTLNVVGISIPRICAFEREFIEAQTSIPMETCVERRRDLRMDAGRKKRP